MQSLETKGPFTPHHHSQTISLSPLPAPTKPLLAILLNFPLPCPCYSPTSSQSPPLRHEHCNFQFPASLPSASILLLSLSVAYIHQMTHPATPKYPDLISINLPLYLIHLLGGSVTESAPPPKISIINMPFSHRHLLSSILPALTGSESA